MQTAHNVANEFVEAPMGFAAAGQLLRGLNRASIRYCHWKSNCRLQASLQGKTDLDLLVDPQDKDRFLQILHESRVWKFSHASDQEKAHIEHFLGMDPGSGNLFHLHVHYALIVGERAHKNYHLPLESALLDSPRLLHGVNIPPPELELALLSLRALIKYRLQEGLRDSLGNGDSGIPDRILEEAEWLLEQTTLEQTWRAVQNLDLSPPFQIGLEFIRRVIQRRRDGVTFLRLRRRALRALRPYRIHSELRLAWMSAWKWVVGKVRGLQGSKLIPPVGGQLVAFIGLDGAGKSTMVKQLATWLSRRLEATSYYFGGAEPSALTTRLERLATLGRLGHARLTRTFGERHLLVRLAFWPRELLHCLYYLSVGVDRYRRYARGLREAARGCIVLCDRYPIEAIWYAGRVMDGPRIVYKATWDLGFIGRSLARLEERLYRRFRLPDHIFVMDVSPEVSILRKPDHDLALMELKNQAIEMWAAENEKTEQINADGTFDQVLLALKRSLWDLIVG